MLHFLPSSAVYEQLQGGGASASRDIILPLETGL